MSVLTPEQWQLLSPYLDRALEMTGAERALWLASLGADNPVLARELEILLRQHDMAREEGFLESDSTGLHRAPGLTGQTLGAYTLVSQAGQGGMGSVWQAERSDGRFERKVAVKFLNIALMGKSGEERFKREGNILGRLTHPNIAELFDSGVSTTGQPYLVLEYVEGEQIDRYCDQHTLDVRSRVRLFLEVLGAVSHAHSNLVVHRDLKSSNVLVRKDGQVKLLDFGIAKLIADEEGTAGKSMLTVEGVRPLTPECAAPEQLQGGVITTSTDVYALGVLLYVLLTGVHPVGTESMSAAELVKAVIEKEPTRPSEVVMPTDAQADITYDNAARRTATPDKLSRLLRGDLDTIIGKALKKNPEDRYPSVTALADDLRRYLRNQPINARPDSFAYRAAKFVRRNRAAVAFSTLAVMATAAGVVGTLIQTRTARAQRDLALRQLLRRQAVNDFNEFLLSDAAPSGKPFTVNELLGRAEKILSQPHAVDDSNRVELLVSIGDQYSTQDDDAEARRVLEQAYKLSRSLPEPARRAEASCVLAGAVARDGDLARAEPLFQEGLREVPSGSQYDLERILCFRRGSEIAQERGEPKEGINRIEAAQAILRTSPFYSDLQELRVSMDLAEAYRMAGLNQQAVSKFEQVYQLLSSLGREDTQSAVTIFNDWALALDRLGRPLEAERLYVRAIVASRAGESEESVSPVILNNYARTLDQLSRFSEAADYAERAYAKARQVDNQFAIYQSLYVRALIYIDQRDFRRAATMLAEVEPRLQKSFPPKSYWFGALASAQALVASGNGNLQEALRLADQSVTITEAAIKNGGRGIDFLPIALLRRSALKCQAARYAESAEDAERVVSLLRDVQGPGTASSYLGRAYYALGRARKSQGKIAEAQVAFQQAAEQLRETLGSDNAETRSVWQQAEAIVQRGPSGPSV